MATTAQATTGAARTAAKIIMPSVITDMAMPSSTGGNGIAAIANAAPIVIITGKTIGSITSNGLPRNAPQIPTATIASM